MLQQLCSIKVQYAGAVRSFTAVGALEISGEIKAAMAMDTHDDVFAPAK